MPIYEYRCASCGAELEKLQKISDPPLRDCPECGKDTLTKLVSASSFRLKGSGWYETDFKTGKKKNGAGDAGGDSSGSTSSTAPDSAKGAVDSVKAPGDASTKESKGSTSGSGKDSAKSSDNSAASTNKPATKSKSD